MATVIDGLKDRRPVPLFARRPSAAPGQGRPSVRKKRQRQALGVRHVLAVLGLVAAIFLAVREAYIFLITWEELDIRKVEVVCAKDGLRRALETRFAGARLGNILLCDLDALRAEVGRLPWVKEVSVKKMFPASLRLTVVERTPFAVLERGGLWLADEDGRALEPTTIDTLTVISADDGFASGFERKWRAAAELLRALPAAERSRLLRIRCGEDGQLEVRYKDDPVVVTVRDGTALDGLALFASRRPEWERLFGPLAAADLSYDGRVYLKPAEPASAPGPGPSKEAS